MLDKKEFLENSSQNKKGFLYQEPNQILIRNYISKVTPYENVLVYSGLGTGKCHKINTPILMYDGTIKMVQDIKIGECLMGDDSTPRKVLSLARGQDKMYDIIPVKGEKYTVNEEHILCLKASGFPNFRDEKKGKYFYIKWIENNEFKIKSYKYNNYNKLSIEKIARQFKNDIKYEQILEISVKEYLKLNIAKKNILKGYKKPVDFEYKNVNIDPYMIGYWLGDGTARDSVITCQDSTVLHYFVNNLPKYNLFLSKRSADYCYGITGCSGKTKSNIFLNTLKDLNLLNNKHIPNIYKCNSREIRLKLLAGLIDSDGSYSQGTFEISQGANHEQLIDDIIYLARSLGFACYKNPKKTSWTYNGEKKKGNSWRIIISGNGIDEIPTKIPRKRATPRKQIKDVLVTGIKVVLVGRDDYYGFTLDGNCRYLMGDFTVTHNTCLSITIAEGFREYINNMNKRIFVLVKNKNIQNNFIDELLSGCTGDDYLDESELKKVEGTKLAKSLAEENNKDVIKRARSLVSENYHFLTYGTFVNRVLGSKIYEKDEFGQSTKKLEKDKEGNIKRRITKDEIKSLNNTVIIVDEAHNITGNDAYDALFKVLSNSYNYRLVLLTATPMTDNPSSIFELSNLLNVKNKEMQLPIRKKLFEKDANNNSYLIKESSQFLYKNGLKGGVIKITDFGLDAIHKALLGKVSYLKANTETNPEKIDKGEVLFSGDVGSMNIVLCEMSDYQYNVYLDALNNDSKIYTAIDFSSSVNNIINEENLIEEDSTSKTNSLYKNSSDASTIVYPDNTFGKVGFVKFLTKDSKSSILKDDLEKYSTKLYKLMQNINKNNKGKVFIYSNYVDFGGTSLLKLLLLQNNFYQYPNKKDYKSFIVFDGKTSISERERLKRIFNSPENKDGKIIRVLIGSPMISEGITLKEIRQVHILEPTWNMSSINQIIGRAVRNYSHQLLDQNERNVEIYKYASVYKDSFSIDKEKYILCSEKDKSNKVVERLLKTIAFDCYLNKSRNLIKNGVKGSAECDYTDCDYSCELEPSKKNKLIDESTYNLYNSFFDQYDIKFIINKLSELFKKDFIWSLNDIVIFIKNMEPLITNEAIYNTLNTLVNEKTYFVDKYNRGGFIINKGPYYIFNSFDIDIDSSLYSKIFDFSVEKNKYSVDDFVKKLFGTKIITTKTSPKKQETVQSDIDKLTESQIEYNQNIENTYKLYGTYRKSKVPKQDLWEHKYGKSDGLFRIIDYRQIKGDAKDAREEMTGKAATSYKVEELNDITKYLNSNEDVWKNIKIKLDLMSKKKLQKVDYAKMIETYMKEKDMILQ